ncbi:hypothetical protein EZMO1_2113 [Endozoicomonas montiporae CL-33]|uniref:Uncharacterized protein n=1 Tax=Endozoicomonas montiporae CL-33 TaxID=570277 RepID=A0A142BBV4_9GAMM|nr:hypothetical protein EZMO1_2113 [Endozoicomonas montiporae CL-33]
MNGHNSFKVRDVPEHFSVTCLNCWIRLNPFKVRDVPERFTRCLRQM